MFWRGRVKGADLETVNPQALEGVPDAMSVSNLTEASLLHTVRERYNRDEVSSFRNMLSKTLGDPLGLASTDWF